jgi:hypothetical protein
MAPKAESTLALTRSMDLTRASRRLRHGPQVGCRVAASCMVRRDGCGTGHRSAAACNTRCTGFVQHAADVVIQTTLGRLPRAARDARDSCSTPLMSSYRLRFGGLLQHAADVGTRDAARSGRLRRAARDARDSCSTGGMQRDARDSCSTKGSARCSALFTGFVQHAADVGTREGCSTVRSAAAWPPRAWCEATTRRHAPSRGCT